MTQPPSVGVFPQHFQPELFLILNIASFSFALDLTVFLERVTDPWAAPDHAGQEPPPAHPGWEQKGLGESHTHNPLPLALSPRSQAQCS